MNRSCLLSLAALRTPFSPWDMHFPALCRSHVWLGDVLLHLRPSLPGLRRKVALPCSAGSQVLQRSPTSPARACPAFGYMAFPDRPCSSAQGALEISRFSCMLFLSVRGV